MSSYVSKKGVKQRINSPPPTEIYLKEIGFISQIVMSDIQSIQVCSGLEQNRRHLQRSPCNPDIHNPDRIHHHIWRTQYRSYSVQSQSIGHPIALTNIRSSTPIINAIHYVVSLFGMGNPNNEHNNLKISVAFKFNKSQQIPFKGKY